MDAQTDGRKVITIAHPEQSSGELKKVLLKVMFNVLSGTIVHMLMQGQILSGFIGFSPTPLCFKI